MVDTLDEDLELDNDAEDEENKDGEKSNGPTKVDLKPGITRQNTPSPRDNNDDSAAADDEV